MLRGETTYKARATQGRDFTGLRYGNITPTDVDGLIEFKNRCYVFIEAKFGNAEMSFGQKTALERLCDDLQKVKPTLLVVAKHNQRADEEIDFAKFQVREYRYNGIWKTPNIVQTLKELIDMFLNKFGAESTKAQA